MTAFANGFSKHHRQPIAQGGSGTRTTLVMHKQHIAWHNLFSGDMTVPDIVQSLNDYWIDPRYIIKCEKLETADPNQLELQFP